MMKIKRCLGFMGLALVMCFSSLGAYASELSGFGAGIYRTLADVQPYGADYAKHELTMAQWRIGGSGAEKGIKSNLIALSNHFGLASAAPFGYTDERPYA